MSLLLCPTKSLLQLFRNTQNYKKIAFLESTKNIHFNKFRKWESWTKIRKTLLSDKKSFCKLLKQWNAKVANSILFSSFLLSPIHFSSPSFIDFSARNSLFSFETRPSKNFTYFSALLNSLLKIAKTMQKKRGKERKFDRKNSFSPHLFLQQAAAAASSSLEWLPRDRENSFSKRFNTQRKNL